MFVIFIRRHFDAAHRLVNYDGECAKLHGHRWVVDVEFIAPDSALGKNEYGLAGTPVEGMIIDFKDLKASLDAILPDHHYLNDLFEFNPTAENLAKWLSDLIEKPHRSVTVWETPDCGVTYYPEEVIPQPTWDSCI